MNLKTNLRLLIVYIVVLFSVTFWVVTVFWTDLIFSSNIKKIDLLSENIFLDDKELQSNYVFYYSDSDLSNYNLWSNCKISSKFLWKDNDKYVFKITYLDKCIDSNIFLETRDKQIIKKSFIRVNLFNKSALFDYFVDPDDESLNKINENIDLNILNLNNDLLLKSENNFEKLKIERKILEYQYQKDFLYEIKKSKVQKYLVPISGHKITKDKNKIPNAERPYRNSYTDWIHHGWDVVAPINTPVIALDEGKIVRIVNNFKFSNLRNLKKNWIINYQDKINNLDILRWNQVWIKTSKWDVVFYAHLSSVSNKIKVWDIIKRWEYLWKVWISGVPDKNYKNFHLHFEIQQNPRIKTKIGKYTNKDYLNWDWYFKWKSLEYVIKNENNIFN